MEIHAEQSLSQYQMSIFAELNAKANQALAHSRRSPVGEAADEELESKLL